MNDDQAQSVGGLIRQTIEQLWQRLHESDLRFGRSLAVPDILSSAMCRHGALYGTAFSRRWVWRDGCGGRSRCRERKPGLLIIQEIEH